MGLAGRPLPHDIDREEGDDLENPEENKGHAFGDRRDLGPDVLDVHPGPDAPVPRPVFLDVRDLREDPARVVLPLPMVIDIAAAGVLDRLEKGLKELLAGGILGIRHILALEVGTVGVHDHPGMGVVDPEVILAFRAVAEAAEMGGGLLFRLLHRDRPPLREFGVVADGTHRRLAEGMDHLPFPLHQVVFDLRQDIAEKGADDQLPVIAGTMR